MEEKDEKEKEPINIELTEQKTDPYNDENAIDFRWSDVQEEDEEDITLLSICDAPGGCSSWTWTGIWDDVRNPLSDFISNSVLRRSNLVFPRHNSLRVFYLGKTEFDLPKTEFEMKSLRGFLTSSQIPVHVQLLHPRCITDTQKGYIALINFI